jgi:hypothetical protein
VEIGEIMTIKGDILKTEIATDPLSRGYSGMTDLEVANDLNTEYRTKARDTVQGWEIFNVTDDAEYTALTDLQKSGWDALCAIEQIDTASGIAKSRESELFGGGTTTRSNLVALKSPAASRAAELGLSFIYEGNVQEARL